MLQLDAANFIVTDALFCDRLLWFVIIFVCVYICTYFLHTIFFATEDDTMWYL